MPLLTFGVVHALDLYASDEQKRLFLPPLVQSAWSGTMNLTEPQAGTDLGAIRTKAVKNGDHYLISGQKIFITWGDHPYTDNIIHLVLARTPDAPEGSRGISMFIVPKYLINEDGSIGERNDVKPVGVEHKLGIHGSPTCTMQFGENGGAIGYLVGEENKGLVYMFAMMNTARLAVGHQGVAVAERAYQQAVDYALDRVQGKTVTGEEGGTIIQHPDVKRMLLQMRAMTEAGRALSFLSQASEDVAHHHPDEAVRKAAALRVDVLTPLVKAWCTEAGVEVTSMGVQVHGGTGFIEETGAAQHYRDARILPIYEGTNGIQALDFIGRKTLADGGNGVSLLLAECGESVAALANPDDEVGAMCDEVGRAIKQCERALAYLAANSDTAPGIAFDFMMLFANTVCGWLMLKSAAIAVEQRNKDASDRFWVQKLATAKFFIEQILPRNYSYLAGVLRGCAATSMLEDGDFSR
jgi:alkylation response protein AidB-like acyl-CoA dehydrogenase